MTAILKTLIAVLLINIHIPTYVSCQLTDQIASMVPSQKFSPTGNEYSNKPEKTSTTLEPILFLLQHQPPSSCTDDALYVAVNGTQNGSGSFDDPVNNLTSARDKIRQIRLQKGLPAGGISVCIRGGVYRLNSSFTLTSEDSGNAGSPIIYRSYNEEKVVLTGAINLQPSWFSPVTPTDPHWSRISETARSSILRADLQSHAISDYGSHVERGFRTHYAHSPMEISVNNQILHLARWPNTAESDPLVPDAPAVVTGNLSPDVTGTFSYTGQNASGNADDGYPNYKRDGLVEGIQYYLYHCTWQDGGARYWFISAYDPQSNPNCWPTGEWGDYPSWASSGEETIPPLDPFKDSTGIATVNNRPEDFKEHGFVRIPEVISTTRFRLPGDNHLRWSNANDIWIQGLLGNYWADNSLAATLYGNELELSSEPSYGLNLKMVFFLYNLIEEIDEAGEYYIDRTSGMLYLYPPASFGNIEASLLEEPIIHGNGVSYVSFSGLTLEMSRGDLIRFEESSNIILDTLILRNNGGTAVRLEGVGNRLENSHIHNSGGSAIEIDGGSRTTLTPGNNTVYNCEIHNYARWDRTYKPAVMLKGVGNRVRHNSIHDAPHFGIFFYGNNHLIEYNRIERVALETNDAGAIYTGRDWGYRGNIIRHNLFKDIDSIFGGSHGVYLDDGASGTTVFGNIFHTINGYAILSGGGRDNIVTNNIIIAAARGGFLSDRRVGSKLNNTFNGDGRPDSWNLLGRLKVSHYNFYSNREDIAYQSPPWSTQYPEAAAIPDDYSRLISETENWHEPEGCIFAENISWLTGRLMVNGSWGGGGATDYFSRITPNLDNVDPLFVDEAGGNLNLSENSPAFDMTDFQPIPYDKMGRERN